MIEFFLLPCNYVHTYYGYTGDSVAEECIKDLKTQQEYLGPLEVIMYINDENYIQKEFGSEAIQRESIIVEQDISQFIPSYYEFKIQTTLFSDESSLLQVSGPDENEFFHSNRESKVSYSSWN